ncbi:hypothetical protein [Dactylosporangium sp. NPDC048998]|uniref:hypothetical protein n=1 Tax=Dactylosporangium sp. NPDC048998 TaxID=3363976 RepID=UPI0037195954
MTDSEWDLDDVLVTISVSAAVAELPLAAWMASGPGPRDCTRPESPRSRSTGEALPPTVIPLAYRNDRESRALIAAGRIVSPWRDVPWDVDNWGEPPCEVRGPRPFDRSVADSGWVDRLAARVLGEAPRGPVDAETARLVLERVPEFAAAAPVLVRRLAAEARWEELDVIVQLAGAAALVDVGPVLCDVLMSDARPPRPGHLVDMLGQLRYGDAARLLESLVGQFVYADGDLSDARRCLRALAVMGSDARIRLTLISWGRDWPAQVPQWAAQELEATGDRIPSPLGPDEWTARGRTRADCADAP